MTDTENGTNPSENAPSGPGASVGKRITGENDPRDPDGLITLNDLPDREGSASHVESLLTKATQYGNGPAQDSDAAEQG